jgi:hypothetical protein
VEHIVGAMAAGGEQRARFILRLVPVLGTCKAFDKNMEELARGILADQLPTEGSPSFCVLFKTRNNNQVRREDTIRLLATGKLSSLRFSRGANVVRHAEHFPLFYSNVLDLSWSQLKFSL